TIMIQHNDGYESLYGHCSKILVEKGDKVETSTIIGRIGSTGRSTGPHLHFTLYHHGKVINPLLFVW
ncbi:MAG: M23 family metallopeptidase, partial [Spirochaetota bacterium]